ncbi:MAG: transposase [Cyclobacteriaceae bacterium]|nr:transposase [Cyclobacteriaceae bacterium]MCK5279336.1 transposase [Cyclobacteriaceae bacterium]MCK5369041.1 transposase [Cyclobacteriaceae bacterium]MCK5469550.1 transposase [Cyclobacteriaceae bacterium]
MVIHGTEKIQAINVPKGSKFKGYIKRIRQELKISAVNTCYELESWQTPEGTYHYAQLPDYLQGTDFGPSLKSYILYQYHQCHVTQPLLLEQLWELDISISSGQLSRIITEGHERFHQEKEDLLTNAKRHSIYLQTDDTGARHQGYNGYCTFIGNDLFSFFKSTGLKSRINFLEILNGQPGYCFNDYAFGYIADRGLSPKYITAIDTIKGQSFTSTEKFLTTLKSLSVSQKYAVKTITEAGLLGHLIDRGMPESMVILSDDAGQFDVMIHALCWIHVERNLQKIHTYTNQQRQELDLLLKAFWQLYQQLKTYKNNPVDEKKQQIITSFDAICNWQTKWLALKKGLDKIKTYKQELLVVLKYPRVPLHNNQSESDIREYVKKRKISGSTRSDNGRKARDTFASLKKTCRKMNISFWDYLNDRITSTHKIKYLPDLLLELTALN